MYRDLDDRSWKISTTLASWASHGACDVIVVCCKTVNLDQLVVQVEKHFEAWLIFTQSRFDAREVRDPRKPEPKIGDGSPVR